jgi:hypothetical protein
LYSEHQQKQKNEKNKADVKRFFALKIKFPRLKFNCASMSGDWKNKSHTTDQRQSRFAMF